MPDGDQIQAQATTPKAETVKKPRSARQIAQLAAAQKKRQYPLRWNPQDALALIQQGKTTREAATLLGVDQATIVRELLKDEHIEAYSTAQATKALLALENAEEGVVCAPDPHHLARARESGRFAQWRLERVLRKLYGQDQQLSGPAVQINLCMSLPGSADLNEQRTHTINNPPQVSDKTGD